MPVLHARLLGELAFIDNAGGEVKLATRKSRALFAFLIAEADRWHPRDRLASLLWSDRQQAQARHSLTQALGGIRKLGVQLGADLIETDADRVRLVADDVVSADLHLMRRHAQDNPEIAAQHYGGPFLDGFLSGDTSFDDWVAGERTALLNKVCLILEASAQAAAGRQEHAAARDHALKWAALEPFSETAHREAIRQLVAAGDTARAIKQFQACERIFRDELGVAPSPETRALIDEIRTPADKLATALAKSWPVNASVTGHTRSEPLSEDVLARITTPDSIERHGLIRQQAETEAPIVAVLPFSNLSDDNASDFFAEGLADDILFALSSFRWFKVLGRAATFRIAQMGLSANQLNQLLTATHLVSGSMRRQGHRLRLSVELTDCRSNQQIWSAHFDEALDDVFEIEDRVVAQIVSAIVPALEISEIRKVLRKPPNSLSAYELLQRGNSFLYRNQSTYKSDEEAQRCYEAAIALDPDFASAYAALAYIKYRGAYKFIATSFHDHLEDARHTALQALSIEPDEPRALRYLGGTYSMLRDQDSALEALRRSIEICPSFATAYSGLAFVYDFRGEFEEAMPAADETIRLRPHDPILHRCIIAKSIASYQTGDYAEAERIARNSLRSNDQWWMSNLMLASSLGQTGKSDEGRRIVDHIKATYPGLSLDKLLTGMPFVEMDHHEHLHEGLVKAGWRDEGRPATAVASPGQLDRPKPREERPSIAVLPFDNLSDDPEQRFLADGLADDIINTLSKISRMRVIARHSTFALKCRSMDVHDIAGKLAVRYVLEGSVRKSGDRLRVTAQLVDAADGAHLWADRFDRHLEDLFDIQDEITKEVVTALQVALTDGEKARVLAKGTRNLAAWQFCVRARELESRLTATHHLEARELAEKAIEIDPEYAYAWGILGFTYFRDGRMDLGASTAQKLARAQEISERAVALDPTAPWGVGLKAMAAAAAGRHDEAIAAAKRAVELQPGSAETRAFAAYAFAFSGLYAEADEQTRIALSLDPFAPSWYHTPLLRSLACRDRFEEALEIADQLLTSEPALVAARVWQTYCFDALGEPEKARASTAELRRHAPHIRTDHVDGIVCLADRELTARIVDAHRRSGLLDAEPAVLDRPSIAVMPFDGLSTAPDQEFLADGMAEDIIAGLSKFRWLLVIARRSTFTYKGQTRDIREIASELGVRYIVEGTVRKSGNRIRVTAQLVDAETGNHIWSDRYDRKMDDIFVIQDEVAEAIIRAVAPEISQAEIERARRLPPENLDAWAHYQRGLAIEASGEEADFSASIEHFDRAVKADPTFADALAMASLQRTRLAHFFRSEHSDRLFSEADQLSRKAMRLDPRNPVALFARGRLLNVRGEFSQALEYCERAVELDPNSVLAHLQLAAILGDADRRWLESLETYERILELSPKDPHRANVFTGRAYNLFYLRRYDECVTSARAALASENPRYWATLSLVAGLAALGRKAELADAMADLLKRKPDITLRHVAMFHTFKTPGYIDALRKAGVPE